MQQQKINKISQLRIVKPNPIKIQEEEIIQIQFIPDSIYPTLMIGEQLYVLKDNQKNSEELIQVFLKNEMKFRKIYNMKPQIKASQITKLKVLTGLEYFAKKLQDEQCPICISPWFETDSPLDKVCTSTVFGLECDHYYHDECLDNCIKEKHIQCPICNRIFGIKTGDQPEGSMVVRIQQDLHCAGYEQYGTIEITYNMKSGQRNNIQYSGTSRIAYLPDCPEGQKVLILLQEAFKRKLIFTVGRSVTTGYDNQTVWAGIHHKTSTTGGSTHFGYPDPTYFERVKQELASKGVV